MDSKEKDQYLKLAEHYFRNNQYDYAKHILEKIISIDTHNSKANELLAYIYENLEQSDISFELLNKACNQSDCSAEALYYLGSFQLKRSLFDKAIETLKKSILKGGEFFEALHDMATAQASIGDITSAINNYEKCINFGKPSHELFYNIARIYDELKRYEKAIFYHDKALRLKPDYAEGWTNKGITLHELKRYEEAIAHYDMAISLKPDYAEGWSNKGITLHELKRYKDAITHFDKALGLKSKIDWISGAMLQTKMKICAWSDLVGSLDIIHKKVMVNERVIDPLSLLAFSDDAFLHKRCSETFAQTKYPSNTTLRPIPKSPQKEKIRIAYFSPDFRNHPVSYLTAELFEIHDRCRFEVFAFSLRKVPVGDETNVRLRKGFDRFIDVDDKSDREIALLARELEIDIAIDLAGATQYSRTGIFSYRAAPIQVNWLGYPGTMGTDLFDYIVADKIVIPEHHQQFYAEKVAYLPNTYMVDDSKRKASARVFTREEFGLPKNTFVFCCFNNDYKFNPQVLDSWSRILFAAKNSVIWISENNEYFRANIATEFASRGINSDRIIFAQRLEMMGDHLSRYAIADLFLDTYPYNAHTTALDSLKAGVPVLTLIGQSFASRVAASLLNAIGLPEFITNTQEEYEELAIELALNPKKLADIKLKLASNYLSAALFNTSLFTKNLETVYIEMHERYHAGLGADHIAII